MNTRKLTLTILILAVIGTIAIAQQERLHPKNQLQPLDAAELQRIASRPSLQQEILKHTAEKLRQEKGSTTTVEMNLTVRVTKAGGPPCWYHACVYIGTKPIACDMVACDRLVSTE